MRFPGTVVCMARHSKASVVSMAAIAASLASLLHEGVGRGLTASLRGDIVTELTSNHLSSIRPDRWVDAGGTIANLIAGTALMLGSRAAGERANLRYFLWIFGALNLLSGAGYFLFSGVLGAGDWGQIIEGWPHYVTWRVAMAIFGALLYVAVVKWSAMSLRPFIAERRDYNTLGRLAYVTVCVLGCVAGAFDPLGIKLLLISTIPALFGGQSGLLWADVFLPKSRIENPLTVQPSVGLPVAAVVVSGLFVAVLGRGVQFHH
jgi:hypothetical protein